MVVMEIVFLNNFLEATKDLEDNEILFCPLGFWVHHIVKGVGGIIEGKENVRPFSDEELRMVKEKILYYNHENTEKIFFYVVKPDLMRRDLEEIFEEMQKNSEYLKKEIVEDLKHLKQILEYDLFVSVPDVMEGYRNDEEAEVVKSMIEKEVNKRLLEEEKKKEKLYDLLFPVFKTTYENLLPQKIGLSALFPESVRELGFGGYIKISSMYKEAKIGEKKALIFLPIFFQSGKLVDEYMGQYLKGVRLSSSLNLVSQIRRPDKVFMVLVESKINVNGEERDFIVGLPFLKVKFSLTGTELGSRNVVIRRREELGSNEGSTIARLKVVDFAIKAVYAKEPKILKDENGERVLELDKYISLTILLRRKEGERFIGEGRLYVSGLDCKISDIEIKEDGSFLTKLDYDNLYFLDVYDSRETERNYPGRGSSDLIEKLTFGEKVKRVGEIVEEKRKVDKRGREKEVYRLKEKYYQEYDKIDDYLDSSFREIVKTLLSRLKEKINEGSYGRLIEVEGKEKKELVEKTQTGFLQGDNGLRYLEKIEREMCFVSKEGERHIIKHPEMEKPEIIAKDLALYRRMVDKEGLKGEKKNIFAVLRLIAYSYPFINSSTLEGLMKDLEHKANSAFSKEKVPLKEIEVSISGLVPRLDILIPGTFILFLYENGEVKAYTNGDKRSKVFNTLKVGIGGMEIEVMG
jgi:hypothetical protein